MASKTVIAFDLYGTLLSTESIAEELKKLLGDADQAKSVATLWRRYQLEYTWRINSMGLYRSFSEITRGALHHALGELGLARAVTIENVSELMKAYDSLHVFPDVTRALEELKRQHTIDAYVFSNGTDAMVGASVDSSPDLAPHKELFRGMVTVEDVKAFKPDMGVYGSMVNKVGKAGSRADVWLVTANPFDVVGAKAAGLQAAWIDRAGTGWVDRLGDVIGGLEPTIVARGVDEAVDKIVHEAPRQERHASS